MTRFYIAVIFLCVLAQAVFVPLFLKAQRTGKSFTSLGYKMISASMFMAVGVLSALTAKNFSPFSRLMLLSLALSWFGDLFLHVPKKNEIFFPLGSAFFFSAHIVFIINYSRSAVKSSGESSRFGLYDALFSFAVYFIAMLLYKLVFSLNFKRIDVLLPLIYAVPLTVMLDRALVFGLSAIKTSLAGGLLVMLGASLFLVSDFLITPFVLKTRHCKSFPLKCANIATYFLGQTCLALSINFIKI